MRDLIVVSTNYRSSDILNTNYECSPPSEWVVVCNDGNKDFEHSDRYTLLGGAKMPAEGPTNSKINKHSMHHALALNKGCCFVRECRSADFLLIRDPDFFIIPDYETIMDHMEENDLEFFGAPYWPDGKNRPIPDFPVAFCMFVDLRKIDIWDWDFSPTYSNDLMTDTGHGIYSKYYEKGSFEVVDPNKEKFREEYPKFASKINSDIYYWKDELFGIHVHAKVHLKRNNQMKSVSNRIKLIGDFVKHVNSSI